jgi:hypothetical protein
MGNIRPTGSIPGTQPAGSRAMEAILPESQADQGFVAECKRYMDLTPAEKAIRDARYEAREQMYRDAWSGFNLSTRAYNTIRNQDCLTIDDVQRIGEEGFKRIEMCGKKTVAEIGRVVGGWNRRALLTVMEDAIRNRMAQKNGHNPRELARVALNAIRNHEGPL